MRIYVLTLGTRGDFELFRMLGAELQRRGHRVTVGTSSFHADALREAGLEWDPVGTGTFDDLHAVLRSLAPIADLRERTIHYVRRWLQPQLDSGLPGMLEVAGRRDYFISNLKLVLARDDAIIPGASVTYDPPGDLAELEQYETRRHGARLLELVAMDRELIDPEGRWGPSFRFTGFWSDRQSPGWTPPAGLASFLASGPPPVVVTMGSMAIGDGPRFVHRIDEALRLCGARGVLVAGWSGIADVPMDPDRMIAVGEVPYDWLFPMASCIIHHGGCGTVGAVLRAGQVSVILPRITCQEHFGRVLRGHRLASAVLDLAVHGPRELAEAIDRAANDPAARRAAATWREIVGRSDGVTLAADLIEAHWDELTRRPA
jgi:UDP:flavonoid glycosyltransferase YjiC (YdhE family)